MADYYPLISRAVAGLEKNNGENRRALYERARSALIAQLRGVTPALPESDITRERLALEESIRKVEAESARQFSQTTLRSRTAEPDRWEERAPPPPSPPPRPVSPAPRVQAPDTGRWSEPAPPRPAAPFQPRAEMPPALRRAAPPSAAPAPRQNEPVFEQPLPAEPSPPAPPAPPPPSRHPLRRPLAERRTVADSGLQDFRDVVTEANELGGASARAAQSARDAYAAMPSHVSEYDRREPRLLDQQQQHEQHQLPADFQQPMLEPSFTAEEMHPVPPRLRQAPAAPFDEDVRPQRRELQPGRSYKEWIKGAGVLAVVAVMGGVLLWQWPNMVAFYQKFRAPAATDVRDIQASNTRPKISDRIEPGAQPSTTAPAAVPPGATVAQKVVLYEEDPADPNGKRFVGSAIWRTETVTPGPGQPPELAIRADIEVPDRKLAMTVSLRRNTDKALPASHTVEITFKTPTDFPSGGISNVPGILMKQAESTRGVPLAGLAVKVTNGFFLIGLSAVDSDKERNLQLLKERAWFDIPVVYNNNRRAILAIEKGTPGDRAFAEAFKVWKQ